MVTRPDGTDYLYAVGRGPDSLLVFDLAPVVDDDVKEQIHMDVVGTLPLPDVIEDEGYDSTSLVGGSRLALADGGRLLLVTNFRDNSVSVFDLEMGAWGEEVRYIAEVGENPWDIVVTPDERYAIVANYLGEIDDNRVSSTLAFIDLDPASDTFLEVVTWVRNL